MLEYRNRQTYQSNKMAEKEVKMVVGWVKFKAYKEIYYKLETRDRKKNISMITRLRERKTRCLV